MLRLHRSERSDALVLPLAEVLREPPPDPFSVDVVAVPTPGVERWLAQRLSHHLGTGPAGEGGVAAHIRFDSPGRVLDDAVAAVLGAGRGADDPWSRERLTWHVLDAVDACAGEPWCAPLARHLGAGGGPDDPRRDRRLQAAAHLAALFSSYGTQRPAMLRAWADGRHEDGAGDAVPADLDWQVRLWQHVREGIGAPGPAERLDEVVAALLDEPAAVDLPDRLSVFGATRLAAGRLRVLAALGEHRDVHLWLPHPSPALWAATSDVVGAAAPTSVRRSGVRPAAEHPLLASMARDVTELQLRLAASGAGSDTHHPAPEPPPTLLGALQARLRDDAPEAPPHRLAPDDRSVQVHACHGRSRQVEVLREALIGLFDADPTLEPRDVIVLCPDIEAVAPLVAATFGLAADDDVAPDTHPGRTLRVRLADRSLRQTNPLLSLLSRLLEMADGRVSAPDVVDLVGSDPVRRRFRLVDEDVDRIRRWAVESGARWGENRARRERFGLVHVAQGTWETALDRILLGAAMAEEEQRYVGSALPLDDVDSTDIELAGRLAELVDRLTAVLADLDGAHPAEHWLDALDRALDLLAGTSPTDVWQEVEARAVLDGARRTAAATRGRSDLRLADVRALLARRLRGRPTRAGFRTGALTLCSLEPMRAVPHRVVVLLGMDDGAFPRGSGSDGDDLLLRDPLIGERDRRGEDRQLFLDALTAATEHLVVLYSGADERTGASRPPAVPVGELLDALDRAAATTDGAAVREQVLVRHPLQTVDERNFTTGALGHPGPFSYDAVAHRAAVVGRGTRVTPGPFLPEPLAPDPDLLGDVDLDDLVRDLEHPLRAFLRRRLGVSLPAEAEDVDDRLPLTLDGLAQWSIGDRLLAAAQSGVDLDRARQAELRRGSLPPLRLGGAVVDDLRGRVEPIAEAARQHASGPAGSRDVTVVLPGGRAVTGTVPGVHDGILLRAVYSKLAAKHRLRAWVQLLAVTAATGTRQHRAVTIGRSPARNARAAMATMVAPVPDEALDHLQELVALRDAALTEPLPLPLAASCAYARARAAGDLTEQALGTAARELRDAYEHLDDYHRYVWGDDLHLEDLLGAAPSARERSWWPEEGTRFGVLARRLWEPLVAHERTETL
ncbi:exodeoxyribonuclease V subunit gamma [Cellulomonas aerilata]|uniref:RecBCD enzyme subunit RecC n=1 Tax=Cellulomonas aerilata TaxID=515326 RepID=A0A512D7E5_9CELL|nr:exodeoxyribonuclease V subunit gamma [Cellulomonas aerilata]GEO32391.1 RecBCD enzyme subunit RecC [Cellulomonas aerilata]